MPRPRQSGSAVGPEGGGVSSLAGRTRTLVWVSYIVLLVQQVGEVWLGNAPWIIWLAIVTPLLIFLPGMLQDQLRSYIWLCFVLLLYFMRLVVALFEAPDNPLSIVGMVAVVTLFISAMMYVRWRAQELRAAAATGSGHGE
jgi:uncharacterized membrane protein